MTKIEPHSSHLVFFKSEPKTISWRYLKIRITIRLRRMGSRSRRAWSSTRRHTPVFRGVERRPNAEIGPKDFLRYLLKIMKSRLDSGSFILVSTVGLARHFSRRYFAAPPDHDRKDPHIPMTGRGDRRRAKGASATFFRNENQPVSSPCAIRAADNHQRWR